MSPTPAPDPSPRPPLAYRDDSFLDSDDGRPLRILAEYLQPMRAFRRQRVHDTVVFFGSARIAESGPLARYYEDARTLAGLVTKWSLEINSGRRFLVCTGGGPGVMEAANRGAAEAGGRTVGLNIGLPHEQRPNPYVTPDLSFEFRYFFMRKLWFAYLARAFVAFPGGFGTMDEMFEILTLSQTRKLDRRILVLFYGGDYWREIVNFDALVRHGTVSPQDLELFRYADTPAEAFDILKQALAPIPHAEAGPALARSATHDKPADAWHAEAPAAEPSPGASPSRDAGARKPS